LFNTYHLLTAETCNEIRVVFLFTRPSLLKSHLPKREMALGIFYK
jgi:hypothetical protein